MSEKFKIDDPEGKYFVTLTVVHWIDLFTRKELKHVVLDSLQYCLLLFSSHWLLRLLLWSFLAFSGARLQRVPFHPLLPKCQSTPATSFPLTSLIVGIVLLLKAW